MVKFNIIKGCGKSTLLDILGGKRKAGNASGDLFINRVISSAEEVCEISR